MVNMDSGLPPSRRKKPVSKKELQRIQNGGKIADVIRQKKEAAHAEEEIQAEQSLQQDLADLS